MFESLFFSVPLIPSGFNITEMFYGVSNLTVTFGWDQPQGSGPEAVVDYYYVVITSSTSSQSNVFVLPGSSQALNVTLNYNTMYSVVISAENCAGRSESFVYPSTIEYSRCYC